MTAYQKLRWVLRIGMYCCATGAGFTSAALLLSLCRGAYYWAMWDAVMLMANASCCLYLSSRLMQIEAQAQQAHTGMDAFGLITVIDSTSGAVVAQGGIGAKPEKYLYELVTAGLCPDCAHRTQFKHWGKFSYCGNPVCRSGFSVDANSCTAYRSTNAPVGFYGEQA